ncbi:hypothetical protein IE81DRAFT_327131 [Ceraceosorus guamensis]|uniref:Uncharacterized protein n=1 Tax=Ceraceosorus guamensis TaxID=1522189 RepID=A0A316VME1_9BASI|nr:hypothetical protein IE81DRAFT_327131 [Ceraceosorus guamensis]PWN38799.1 hypothetical protein IE81DRAFT_327131 [Ceraceosorus guamensis]
MRLPTIALAACTLLAATLRVAGRPSRHSLSPRQSATGYANPTDNGGSWLTTTAVGLGEPLNVIISGESDEGVLSEEGVVEYFRSLFYSEGSCFNITLGNEQAANLGDGQGTLNQTDIKRYNYYLGDSGTCLQSLNGGPHFRYWQQSTTRAWFLATSYSDDADTNHMIIPNGYDLNRDQLSSNATNATGTFSPGGFEYTATRTQAPLLADVPLASINHGIATDGNVDILTVRIRKTGTLGANSNQPASVTNARGGGSSGASKSVEMSTAAMLLLAVPLGASCLL